jgi:hypothetical protein
MVSVHFQTYCVLILIQVSNKMNSLIHKRRFISFSKEGNFVTIRFEAIFKVKLLKTFVRPRFHPKGETLVEEFRVRWR